MPTNSKSPEINILLHSFALGGTEKFAIEFANYLVANNWIVNIITFRPEDNLSRANQLSDKVSIISINAGNALMGYIKLFSLRSELMKNSSAILGLQNSGNLALLFFPKHKYGKKISTIRRQRPAKSRILLNLLLNMVYRESDLILTNVITAEADYKKFSQKIDYFPNAVEIPTEKEIQKKIKPHIVLTIANLRPEKNLDLLLDIAFNLKNEEIKFVILGSGPELGRLEIRKVRQNLKVEFVGRVIETSEHLRRADLYLHTSKSEGFPNSILEAMAHSLPVIATNLPSSIEALGNTDTVFALSDSQAAADLILSLLSNLSLTQSIGNRNAKRVHDKFSKEAVFPAIMNSINNLAE